MGGKVNDQNEVVEDEDLDLDLDDSPDSDKEGAAKSKITPSDDGVVVDLTDDDIESIIKDQDDGGVSVDVGENGSGKAHKFSQGAERRIGEKKALRAKVAQLTKKIEALEREKVAQNHPVVAQPSNQSNTDIPRTREEWDALAKKDWFRAVSLMNQITAQQVQETQQHTAVLEESKKKVLDKHPELDDPTSQKSQIFTQMINRNPRYLQDPRGPIHAMRDMEEYMEEQLGIARPTVAKARMDGVNAERERIARTSVTAPGRTIPKNDKSVVLTKDEVAFCKLQGIKIEDYAKQKHALQTSKEVVNG